MSVRITVVLLHPADQQARVPHLQQTLQIIRQTCSHLNIPLDVRQVPQLKHPLQLQKEIKGRIAPKPIGLDHLDDWIDENHRALDAYRVAQWFHHEIALRAPLDSKEANGPPLTDNDIIWILEDDTVFVEKSIAPLTKLLPALIANKEWKTVFTGACQLVAGEENAPFRNIATAQPPISHESYLMRVGRVREILAANHLETIRSTFAGFLWWMACAFPNETFGLVKAVTIDGSKLGMFPSTMSSASMPVLNNDYKQLVSLCASAETDVHAIKTAVNKLKKIKCGNGLLPYIHYLQRSNKHEEALELAEEAFQWKSAQNGLMSPTCPLLAIILEHYREENTKKMVEVRKQPSKISTRKLA